MIRPRSTSNRPHRSGLVVVPDPALRAPVLPNMVYRDAIDELCLPDRSHFLGALIAVHRTRLHIHPLRRHCGRCRYQAADPPANTALQDAATNGDAIDDRQFGFEIGSLRRSSESRRTGLDGPACCCAYARRWHAAAAPTEENGEFAIRPLRSGIRNSFNLPQTELG